MPLCDLGVDVHVESDIQHEENRSFPFQVQGHEAKPIEIKLDSEILDHVDPRHVESWRELDLHENEIDVLSPKESRINPSFVKLVPKGQFKLGEKNPKTRANMRKLVNE